MTVFMAFACGAVSSVVASAFGAGESIQVAWGLVAYAAVLFVVNAL